MTGNDETAGPRRPARKGYAGHTLRLGSHQVHLPRSRPLRLLLGGGLVVGGLLGFLPVLGLWMFPLGLAVLSIDVPPIRRLRRRTELWWGRSGARERTSQTWGRLRRQMWKLWPGPRD